MNGDAVTVDLEALRVDRRDAPYTTALRDLLAGL